MTERKEILERAEEFVRQVVTQDFKQNPDNLNISAIAERVSRAIPDRSSDTSDTLVADKS